MLKRAFIPFIALALLSSARAGAEDPKLDNERYRLDNGLEVILHRDNRIPLVAVNVWFHVGSGDEVAGKSGFAHLFEHMLFQGSKHVGEDRHFEILQRVGASTINGTTNTDRTNYFQVVPSHQIETALWLESDRMGYFLPMLTEQSFRNQVEVVRNERRQRYDNVPYGKTRFVISKGLYPVGHPYRYLTIGRHEDLDASSLEDVVAFYEKWYRPANATLAIAGDFDTEKIKGLVRKWFGSFPASTKPSQEPVKMPVIERSRTESKDPFAKLRRIDYVWHTPAFFAPGDAEFDIIASTLGRTGTGRLYKILVRDEQLAQQVYVFQASQQFSSYFQVSVTAKTGADLAEIERIMNEEIERIREEPISGREFERFIANTEASVIWGLESVHARADLLQRYNHYVGEPDYLTQDLDRYRKTTREKITEFARQFLAPERRVEVLTVPAEEVK